MFFPVTTRSSFRSRRQQVAQAAGSTAVLVAAGLPLSRNYPANHHPFRASSHFLYLATARENNFLLLDGGKTTLFAEAPDRDDALWHGPRPELLSG